MTERYEIQGRMPTHKVVSKKADKKPVAKAAVKAPTVAQYAKLEAKLVKLESLIEEYKEEADEYETENKQLRSELLQVQKQVSGLTRLISKAHSLCDHFW